MFAVKCFSYFAATVLVISVLTPPLSRAMVKRNADRGLLRKLFKCPACEVVNCPLPAGYPDCELVLEPGVCGCCQVCARRLGEFCGLSTGRCAKDLSCRPLLVTLTPWAPSCPEMPCACEERAEGADAGFGANTRSSTTTWM